MFRYLIQISDNDFYVILSVMAALATALLLGIAFHEFCHAFSASQLGDQTARREGRVTLNPIAHLDPLGTLLLVFVGFGWGKPVPVNIYALRNGPRTGMAIVAAAGPLSNVAVAAVLAVPLRLGWIPAPVSNVDLWSANDYVGLFLITGVFINCTLAVFNLLPIAPLDGFRVWAGLLPEELARPLIRTERYGILILMGLLFLAEPLTGVDVYGSLVRPIIDAIADGLMGT